MSGIGDVVEIPLERGRRYAQLLSDTGDEVPVWRVLARRFDDPPQNLAQELDGPTLLYAEIDLTSGLRTKRWRLVASLPVPPGLPRRPRFEDEDCGLAGRVRRLAARRRRDADLLSPSGVYADETFLALVERDRGDEDRSGRWWEEVLGWGPFAPADDHEIEHEVADAQEIEHFAYFPSPAQARAAAADARLEGFRASVRPPVDGETDTLVLVTGMGAGLATRRRVAELVERHGGEWDGSGRAV